jgi:hypothetical protein
MDTEKLGNSVRVEQARGSQGDGEAVRWVWQGALDSGVVWVGARQGGRVDEAVGATEHRVRVLAERRQGVGHGRWLLPASAEEHDHRARERVKAGDERVR